MRNLNPYVVAFLAGIVYSLAWPTFLGKGLIVTAIPGMAALFWTFAGEKSFKKKIWLSLAFALPYTVIGFYWIPGTLAEFGQLPYPVALLLGLLFTFISAPQLYLFALAFHAVPRVLRSENWDWSDRRAGFVAAGLAATLTIVEYYTPQQFTVLIGQPWGRIGEYLGYASVGGLPLYGFISFLAAIEIVRWFKTKSFSKLNLATVALFILTNPLSDFTGEEKNIRTLNLRLTQANISNFLKIDSESGGYASVTEVINRYRELSEKPFETANGETTLDLLIWPETAYPFGIETKKDNLSATAAPEVLSHLALLHQADLFIGGYDILDVNGGYYQSEYNSNFHISPNGRLQDVFHKHILIPFGETLPFGPLNEYLSRHIDNISFFSKGETFPKFTIATGHSFINTICYEILKPEFVREYLNKQDSRPHALVNLTNDSWYGDTSEPEQHLFLAAWRALEFDLPIIRSTNTGISTVINAKGQEIERLGVGETGNLDLSIELGERRPTIFQRFGFWAQIPLWLALFLFHSLLIKFKR